MRWRFNRQSLQAGEAVLASFSDAELTADPLERAWDVYTAVTNEMESYLASIATTRKITRWPDITDLTGIPYHVLVRRAGRDLLQSWDLARVRAEPNTFVAELVDAILNAQAARETPGKTRWLNYPEPT